ncbi:MAG TPA: hypothetical protein VK158_02230 [Acidobacteriota bacterium]|nr:hypothetical protein [Acidobacteriota bacterium]
MSEYLTHLIAERRLEEARREIALTDKKYQPVSFVSPIQPSLLEQSIASAALEQRVLTKAAGIIPVDDVSIALLDKKHVQSAYKAGLCGAATPHSFESVSERIAFAHGEQRRREYTRKLHF